MVGDPSGHKRLFSKIESGNDLNYSFPDATALTDETERREFIGRKLAVDAQNDVILISSKWIHKYLKAENSSNVSPVILAKGLAGNRVSQEVYNLLHHWYGTNSSVVAIRMATLNQREAFFESIDAPINLGISKALSVDTSTHDIWITGEVADSVNDETIIKEGRKVPFDVETGSLELGDSLSLAVVSNDIWSLGHVGLGNMGNTCFMNSSLQSLMHIPELALYFASGAYHADLNRDNPIGCHGEVAEAFAELVQGVYGASTEQSPNSIRPFDFLRTIGKFNRSFASRMQQDSQEFTAFLLDSLHEDLNRVIDKPATEKPELEDETPVTDVAIRDLAERSWESHKKRNDSAIMDLFTGMYKSTLICPVCDKVSVTFDPFFDLTLPLPSSNIWTKQVTFVPAVEDMHDSSTSSYLTEFPSGKVIRTDIALPPNSTVVQMKEQVAELLGRQNSSSFVAADVYDHKFYRILKDIETVVESIEETDDIVVYEQLTGAGKTEIPVYLRYEGLGAGLPFFISVDETDPSAESIRKAIGTHLRFLASAANAESRNSDGDGDRNDGGITDIASTAPEEEPLGEVDHDNTSEPFTINVFDGSIDEIVYGYGGSRLRPLVNDTTNVGAHQIESRNSPSSAMAESFINIQPEHPHNETAAKLPTPASSPSPTPYSPSSSTSSSISPLSSSISPPGAADSATNGDTTNDNTLTYCSSLDPINTVLVVDVKTRALIPRHETFQKVVNPAAVTAQSSLQRNKNTSLENCLRSFSEPEVLGDQDLWYCPRCKEFRKAQKQLELWRVPDVLMIHLKRFSGMQSLSRKINDLVTFPRENLNLREYVSEAAITTPNEQQNKEDLVYDLIAVDNHYGGMGGGHYTAYVKDFNGKWYDFNDSYVSAIDPENVCSEAAYLLFYKRRSSTSSDSNNSVLKQQISQISLTKREEKKAAANIDSSQPISHEQDQQHKFPDNHPSDSVFVGEGKILGTRDDTHEAPRLPWADI